MKIVPSPLGVLCSVLILLRYQYITIWHVEVKVLHFHCVNFSLHRYWISVNRLLIHLKRVLSLEYSLRRVVSQCFHLATETDGETS